MRIFKKSALAMLFIFLFSILLHAEESQNSFWCGYNFPLFLETRFIWALSDSFSIEPNIAIYGLPIIIINAFGTRNGIDFRFRFPGDFYDFFNLGLGCGWWIDITAFFSFIQRARYFDWGFNYLNASLYLSLQIKPWHARLDIGSQWSFDDFAHVDAYFSGGGYLGPVQVILARILVEI